MTEIILIADRVLIRPDDGERQTESGLVLPASVSEKEKVHGGRIAQVGPGYITANPEFTEGEPWLQGGRDAVRYLPLQARPGDYAFFLRKEAIELTYEGINYLIVSHGAIVALIREDVDSLLPSPEDVEGLDEDFD